MAKQITGLAGEIAELLLPELRSVLEESLADLEPVRESLRRLQEDVKGSTLERELGDLRATLIEVERIFFNTANDTAQIFFGPSPKDQLELIEQLIEQEEEAVEQNRGSLAQAQQGNLPQEQIDKIEKHLEATRKELARLEALAAPIRAQLGRPASSAESSDDLSGLGFSGVSDEFAMLVDTISDTGLTFDTLVQAFGEAVSRVDESSERFKAAIDGLIGPGEEMEGEIEPGFRRAALAPDGGSAGAAMMPVNGEFARASAGMTGFVADTEDSMGVLEELFEGTFGAFEQELIDALETGKAEWEDFARVAIDAIGGILAEQAKLLFGDEDAPGGGAGGLLGGLVSGVVGGIAGAFAHGGRPTPGLPALVGEQGPELFVPDGLGTILPNDVFAGESAAPTVITNFTIDARGAERGVERRIAEAMAQAEQRISQNVMAHILNNARRGGAFARMSRR